jgi:hypothetical protein
LANSLVSGYNWWNGVDVTSSQYLIYSDTFSQGQATFANSRPTAWTTPDLTDASLLALINTLPDRVGLPGFTDVTSAVNWMNQTGKYYLVKTGYDDIVNSGLIANFDAGWYNSYPGTGTSIHDISGNFITGTLFNGVGFSSIGQGSLSFDGTDDYVQITQTLSTPITICGWVRYNTQGKTLNTWLNSNPHQVIALSLNRTGVGDIYVYIGNGSSWLGVPAIISSANMVVDTWYHLAFVSTGSGSVLYMNGVNVGSSGISPSGWGTFYRLGGLNFGGEWLDGNIATTSIYNRALSQSEIIQNFNAQRYRFGINNDVITGGQVNYLNASETVSYPGSGTSWKDLSGNQTNATLYNGPTFNSTTEGIVFDGSDDYALYGVNLGPAYTVITVAKSTNAVWNDFSGLGSRRILGGFILHNNTDTINTTFYYIKPPFDYVSFATLEPSDNNIQRPHFYAMSTNGTNLHKAYIDSNVSSTSVTSENLTSSSGGVYLAKDDFLDRYNGMTIYKHMIYSRQLSDTEILQNLYQGNIVTNNLQVLMDAGNRISYDATGTVFYDLTANLNNANLVNTPTWENSVGGNLYFDGVNEYFDFTSTTGIRLNGDYSTFSMWCYIRSVGPNGYAELYSVWGANRTAIKWQSDGVGMDANGDFYNVFVNTTNPYNQWMNITCVIDRVNSVFKVYRNGVFIGSDTFTSYSATSTSVTVGGNTLTGNGGDYIKGSISNLMVYNIELTPIQIADNFNAYKSRFGL